MNISLFITVATLLGSIYIWIGKSASQNIKTNDDYYLMGRKLSYFQLALTLLATQLGGGTLIGAAQEAYQKGWIVLLYPLGNCLGLCFLGLKFGAKLRELNISTIAEIFEKIYSSRPLRYIASSLSIIALFFVLTAMVIAARFFFASMGLENPLIFIIFWSILIAYTVMGGLKAVVNTDILQALFIIGSIAIAFFSIKFTSISMPVSEITNSFGFSKIPWMGWLFLPLLFTLIEQDMGQRCFAAKNSKIIPFSAVTAGVSLLICSSVAIYFGILAKRYNLQFSDGASILLESVKTFTNPFVTTLFMGAIFMAVISTADSILCSISSNLSYDFLSLKKINSNKQLKLSRLLTLCTGLISLAVGFFFNNVVAMLILSYEFYVCTLFVPIVAAIWMKNPSKLAAFLSIIAGALGFITFRFITPPIPKELLTISLSFLGFLVGQKITSKSVISKGVTNEE